MKITITIEDDRRDSVEVVGCGTDDLADQVAAKLNGATLRVNGGIDEDGFRALIDPKEDR